MRTSLTAAPVLVRACKVTGRSTSTVVLERSTGATTTSTRSMRFAVPLITTFGATRTGLIYLAAGLGGGAAASLFGVVGSTTVGSSGAVAGLFGWR